MSTVRPLSIFIFAIILLNFSCEQKYNQGKIMYDFHCAGCHLEDGSGLGEIYPPLTKSDYVIENIENFPCIISKGISGPIVVDGKEYNEEMPGNKGLTPVEISNIINYMNHTFDYGLPPQQLHETKEYLKRCE